MAWESPPGRFRGLNLDELGTDEAYVNFTTQLTGASLYSLSENCDKCPWQHAEEISGSIVLKQSTHHKINYLVLDANHGPLIRTDSPDLESSTICQQSVHLGEFGVYDFNIDECSVDTALEPVNGNLALLVCFLVYVALALVCFGLKKIPSKPVHKFETWLGWRTNGKDGGKQRLRSLDTFRGIALAIMIFVNDGGGRYWFLEHATWNGLYVADLVFPWFLWIMGVCIPMSVKSNNKKQVPMATVVWQITLRSVKLFLLGFILNTLGGWIMLDRLRVPGVLQRFGIAYFVVAVVGNLFSRMKRSEKEKEVGWFTDILDILPQWVVMLAILLVHQLVMWLVAAPGCLKGYRGPGGLHDWSPERNNSGCIGGITGYIDKAFFTKEHIYGNPTARTVYQASEFDPEGIFGTLPTIFQVWLGYQAGYTLQVYSDDKNRVGRWLIWSAITGVIGTILCGGSQNDGWVPLNKNLWSLSFVMVTSCFAFALLSFLYIIIDKKKWWKGQPFFYAGMNSILLYCGHSVGYNLFPWHFKIGEMRTHAASLPEALWGTTLWIFIAFVLYKKKVFVTV